MNTIDKSDFNQAIPANLARQLGAIIYDLVLLFAILLFSIAIISIPAGMIFEYEIESSSFLFRFYLLNVIFWFYAYFWIKGGQTLGMRAWRIKLLTEQGHPLSLRHAFIRFFASWLSIATLGFGLIASLWHINQQSWHDRLSKTQLVIVKKDT